MEATNDEATSNLHENDRHCANCKITVTPLWRKFGPVKFLCNACGLYYKVNGDHRPYYMNKNKLNAIAKKSLLRCGNCGTNKTTMWRKNGGVHVCNACGLYFRINGHNRPITMRKDVIRTRRRRDTTFEMVSQMDEEKESNKLVLSTEIERQSEMHYAKHHSSYKMVINTVVRSTPVEAHSHHVYQEPHTYHHQHTCATAMINGPMEANSNPSSMATTTLIDNNYYCSFC